MLSDERALARLGVVAGTHGLRGDLKIRPSSPDATALSEVKQVLLRQEEGVLKPCRIQKVSEHKAGYIVRFEGFADINEVEPLVGAELLVALEDLPARPDGSCYWTELEGMTVVDRHLGEIGTMIDIFTTAAHDIYVVDGRYGEVLIPAVPAFIVKVDAGARRVDVDLPEGMVPEVDDV